QFVPAGRRPSSSAVSLSATVQLLPPSFRKSFRAVRRRPARPRRNRGNQSRVTALRSRGAGRQMSRPAQCRIAIAQAGRFAGRVLENNFARGGPTRWSAAPQLRLSRVALDSRYIRRAPWRYLSRALAESLLPFLA